MRIPILAAAAMAIMPLAGCATYGNPDPYSDPGGRDYYRDYRPGSYQPYPLTRDSRVYRGSDGRYYCDRSDGTVGLVVGAGVGGLLGNLIAPRGSNTIGTLLGAAGGAAIGYAIERGEVQCQ